MSKINYREDQLPIINYEGGKMAVPAVPGAGKGGGQVERL